MAGLGPATLIQTCDDPALTPAARRANLARLQAGNVNETVGLFERKIEA